MSDITASTTESSHHHHSSDASSSTHHHHHHRHHSRRRRQLKLAFKRGLLFGASAVALMATLVIIYFGMRGADGVEIVLLKLSPVFLIIGCLIWGGVFFKAKMDLRL